MVGKRDKGDSTVLLESDSSEKAAGELRVERAVFKLFCAM